MSRSSGPREGAILASVFLVSFAVLAFEVSLTRVFVALLSYHYAFLAVSGAVCGLGLGGFGWHVMSQTRLRGRQVGWMALCFALSMPLTLVLLFGAGGLLATRPWAAVVILVPFTFAGAFLAEVFRQGAAESGRLYQADLAGAAVAAVVVVPLIGFAGALDLVFLVGGVAALGSVGWAVRKGNTRLLWSSATAGCVLFASWPLGMQTRILGLKPFARPPGEVAKLLIRDLARPDLRPIVVDTEWTAYARTDFVRYPQADYGAYTLLLFTDGETPSNMTPFHGDLAEMTHLRDDLPYVAFDMSPRGRLLSIGPGGGMDFLWAMLAGFKDMEGVEINDSVFRLMDRYRKVNGDLYHHPGVRVAVEDGRSYIRRSRDQYDLISSSLTQTATTGNVGLSLVESYIHTKEAFEDYYRHLTREGRYALVAQTDTVLLRGALTAIAVMQEHGVAPTEACRHLMALGLPEAEKAVTPYRYLLVWKKSPFTEADLAPARRAIRAMRAIPVYLPDGDGDGLLDGIARGAIIPEQLFEAGVPYEGVRINVAPASDDRPFFLDLSFGVPGVLGWFLVGSFALAVLYSGVFLRRHERAVCSIGPWTLYFSGLGVGFMVVEIPLIQKLILFLGHPTISLAAVLFYLLIGASVGSRISQGWSLTTLPRRAAIASLLVVAGIVIYLFALSPLLEACQTWPRSARLLVLGGFVLPFGLCLGVPFPSGIRLMALRLEGEIPWMWGVNGMMSVVGSAFAAVFAKFIGFSGCLLIGALVYAAIALGLLRLRLIGTVRGRGEALRIPHQVRAKGEGDATAAGRSVAAVLVVGVVAVVACVWAVTARPGAARVAFQMARSDWSPLHRAAFEGEVEAVSERLAAGAEVNAHSSQAIGWTPLHEAAFVGHEEVVRLLLAHAADANARDEWGRTPLHVAAWVGDGGVAKLLLEAGAKGDARDRNGVTPLVNAASVGQVHFAQLLLDAGAEVSAADNSGLGWTPLHAAVLHSRYQVAELLLSRGADVNIIDRGGRSLLHIAAWTGEAEQVRFLLSHGADTEIQDREGKTALALAEERGNEEVAEMLRQAGAH